MSREVKAEERRGDKQIEARDLKVGDLLHLTFMGGEEYCEVTRAEVEKDAAGGSWVVWEADSPGGFLKDEVSLAQTLWVKA